MAHATPTRIEWARSSSPSRGWLQTKGSSSASDTTLIGRGITRSLALHFRKSPEYRPKFGNPHQEVPPRPTVPHQQRTRRYNASSAPATQQSPHLPRHDEPLRIRRGEHPRSPMAVVELVPAPRDLKQAGCVGSPGSGISEPLDEWREHPMSAVDRGEQEQQALTQLRNDSPPRFRRPRLRRGACQVRRQRFGVWIVASRRDQGADLLHRVRGLTPWTTRRVRYDELPLSAPHEDRSEVNALHERGPAATARQRRSGEGDRCPGEVGPHELAELPAGIRAG